MTTLELVQVRWSHATGPILGPIDLHVGGGERVALIGHHGSGKTTVLRLLVGALDPMSGSVLVDEHPPNSKAATSLVSAMLHPLPLHDEHTMFRHLELAAGPTPADDWRDDAADLADRLGLADRFDDPVRMFSRGMRQKLAICMALVREFEVLILDEPFGGLDARSKRVVLDLLDLAHGYGATVIVATNDLEVAARSDRVIAVRDGRIVADTSPNDDLGALVAEPDASGRDAQQELE